MDRYCPECNSNMTPSLVGYLCPDCGHVQRFYTMTGTQLKSTSIPTPKATLGADGPEEDKLPSAVKIDANNEANSNSNNKVRSTLKRLMVPELPPPHDHGSPAKLETTTAAYTPNSSNIFENYDDLIDTTVKNTDVEAADTADASLVNEEVEQKVEQKVQKIEQSRTETQPKQKRVPLWVWLASGLIIFLTTAVVLLLLVVL
jgi:hypothetical protein